RILKKTRSVQSDRVFRVFAHITKRDSENVPEGCFSLLTTAGPDTFPCRRCKRDNRIASDGTNSGVNDPIMILIQSDGLHASKKSKAEGSGFTSVHIIRHLGENIISLSSFGTLLSDALFPECSLIPQDGCVGNLLVERSAMGG
ncbi:MAG: hypothetical protein AB2404_09515, partial [Planifilum fimeticola]